MSHKLWQLKYAVFLVLLLLCIAPSIVSAQEDDDDTCPTLVELAIQSASEACDNTGRNEACYGNVQIEAVAQSEVSDFSFEQVGDIVSLGDVQSLALNGLDTETAEWGVAILRVQANLPDTLPGQNVTFVLFGDVQIEDASADFDGEFGPMQAFYFSSGIGDSACNEAPNSGILVQTPEGVAEVNLNVNGVDVSLGSTAFLQATEAEADVDGELRVSLLEGGATVSANEASQTLEPGQWLTTLFDEDFTPVSEPSAPEPEEADTIISLPITLLEREIELPEVSNNGSGGSVGLDVVPLSGVWGISDVVFGAGEGCPAEMVQAFEMMSTMGMADVSGTFNIDWASMFGGEMVDSGEIISLAFGGFDETMLTTMMGDFEAAGTDVPEFAITSEDGVVYMNAVMDGVTLNYQFVVESETRVAMSTTIDTGLGCPFILSTIYEYQG